MDAETRREIDGRLSITHAQTLTGTTFQFMNMYQFTVANPMGQTEMWTTTENWISKQKNSQIVLQGDLNSRGLERKSDGPSFGGPYP